MALAGQIFLSEPAPILSLPATRLSRQSRIFVSDTNTIAMKKINLVYWISTVLFAGFMIFTAVPAVMLTKEAVAFMKDHLGYPNYFTVFLNSAKILGSLVILVPGFNRIKEWAYAGLFFDLVGAVYSILSVDGFQPGIFVIALPLVVGAISYFSWRKRIAATSAV